MGKTATETGRRPETVTTILNIILAVAFIAIFIDALKNGGK